MAAGSTTLVARLLTWWRRHRLSLDGLSTPTQRVARAGLVVAGLAAVTVLALTVRRAPAEIACSPLPPSSRAARDIAVLLGADTIALVAIGSGTVLLALAGSAGGWRYPRLRFLLLALVAGLAPALAVLIYPYRPLRDGGWLSGPAVAGWPLASLAALVAVGAATGWRGPRRPARLALVLAAPFVSIFLSAAGTLLLFPAGCFAVRQLNAPMALYGSVSGLAAFALLLWLAVDGLRLSGDVGGWLLDRYPGPRLVNGILLLKAAGFLVVLLLIREGLIGGASQIDHIWGALLAALLPTLLICLLLFREKRLVGISADRFSTVVRIFGIAVAIWLTPLLASYALPVVDATAQQRLPVLTGMLVLLVGSVAVGRVSRWRRGPARWALLGGLGLATCGYVGWAVAHPVSPPGGRRVNLMPSTTVLILLIVVTAVGVLVGLLIQAFRPRLRPYRAFILAVIGWLVLTQIIPAGVATLAPAFGLAAPNLFVTGTGLDAMLLVAATAIFLLHRRGRLRSVSDQELILLLITTTLLLELPVIADLLPAGSGNVALVVALLGPGLTTLALDAEPLNARHGSRPQRVVGTIGVLCLAYGLLVTAAMIGRESLQSITKLSDQFSDFITLPIAVILVAAHSVSAAGAQSAVPAR